MENQDKVFSAASTIAWLESTNSNEQIYCTKSIRYNNTYKNQFSILHPNKF